MRSIYIVGVGVCLVLLAYNASGMMSGEALYAIPTVVGLGALATSLAGVMTLDD